MMRTLMACFLLALATGARAADTAGGVFIYGVGSDASCGQFVAAMETNRTNVHSEIERNGVKFVNEKEQVLQYVFGFLTGANYYRSSQIKLDNAAVELWLKNYCTKNPTARLTDAIGHFIIAQDEK